MLTQPPIGGGVQKVKKRTRNPNLCKHTDIANLRPEDFGWLYSVATQVSLTCDTCKQDVLRCGNMKRKNTIPCRRIILEKSLLSGSHCVKWYFAGGKWPDGLGNSPEHYVCSECIAFKKLNSVRPSAVCGDNTEHVSVPV